KEATIINERNMNPFVFGAATLETIEKMANLNSNIGVEAFNQINSQKFLSVNEIDINSDGIPDQWKNLTPNNAEVGVENGLIVAKKIDKSGAGAMQTRPIALEEGKKYKLELVLDNDVKEVSYQVINYHKKYQKLEKIGAGVFSAEIEMTSEEINNEEYSVRLRIDKDLVIKSLTVSQVP
ncbi:MAG TPA: polymerase, partial [Acetivibrio sp.]|nr:polymerase [Acetivibrio sp.]